MNINELQNANNQKTQVQNTQKYSVHRSDSPDFSHYVSTSKSQEIQSASEQNQQDEEQKDEEKLLLQQAADENPNIAYVQNFQNMNNELFEIGIADFKSESFGDKDMMKFQFDFKDMNLSDIKLFEGLTQKSDVAINSFDSQTQTFNMNIKGENIDVSYRSIEVSKTLFTAIDNAAKTGKPVRLDFGQDTSVILKIGKDGKLSADFIPNDKAMEMVLKNALPELRSKFEEENIPYGTLNYKQSNQQKDKQNNNKEKDKNE